MTTWLAVALGAVGTFALRASFFVFADRFETLSDGVQRVLRQIPPAVLAALVAPALLRPDDRLSAWSPELVAGVLAGLVGWKTKSIPITLAIGMVAVVVAERVGI